MLYTIGTSNRSVEEFFDPLQHRSVQTVFDVRSRPKSRLVHFDAEHISAEARRRGIGYAWLGDVLGGWSDRDADAPAASAALQHIATYCADKTAAIFCSEGDPSGCHRTWFVGAALMTRHAVTARSILRDNSEEDLAHTLARGDCSRLPDTLRDEVTDHVRGIPQRLI